MGSRARACWEGGGAWTPPGLLGRVSAGKETASCASPGNSLRVLSLQGRQGGRGLPVSPEAPTVPLSQKQGSSLKLFLASAHLLVVPTPLWPVLNPDSRLMGLPSGPSRLPKAIPGPLRSSCPDSLQVQGKMRLSKIPAALALPASSSQSKGHQALALGPLAIRPFLYSSPNTFDPRLPRALCPNG